MSMTTSMKTDLFKRTVPYFMAMMAAFSAMGNETNHQNNGTQNIVRVNAIQQSVQTSTISTNESSVQSYFPSWMPLNEDSSLNRVSLMKMYDAHMDKYENHYRACFNEIKGLNTSDSGDRAKIEIAFNKLFDHVLGKEKSQQMMKDVKAYLKKNECSPAALGYEDPNWKALAGAGLVLLITFPVCFMGTCNPYKTSFKAMAGAAGIGVLGATMFYNSLTHHSYSFDRNVMRDNVVYLAKQIHKQSLDNMAKKNPEQAALIRKNIKNEKISNYHMVQEKQGQMKQRD